MIDIVAQLIMHGQLKFENGKIVLLDQNVAMTPMNTHIDLAKYLNDGGVQSHLYLAAKNTGVSWNQGMLKNYSTKTRREIFDWGKKVMSLAGFGDFNVVKGGLDSNRNIWVMEKSQVAELFLAKYGKSLFPVCHVPRGFYAGAASFLYEKNLDAVETKCVALGDQFCEFVIDERKNFQLNESLLKQLQP